MIFKLVPACLAGLTLASALAAPPQAGKKPPQICAWILETRDDDFQTFDLWLEADRELEFLYVIGGQGIVRSSGKSHSPSRGSYVLNPHKAEKVWGYGTNPGGPAKVDIAVDIRQKPADIFSKTDPPLLATFAFRRDIPESETKPPATFAKKQCAAMK
jgi:hypothetical protein